MNLIIEQEGIGKLQVGTTIPKELQKHIIDATLPVSLTGEGFKALFQQFIGKGFRVWFSRYWMATTTVLKATGDIPTLELRISLSNTIKGSWDKIIQPELSEYYYQFGFVPHVVTRAMFDGEAEYQTFDIHFDLSFLEDLGLDYATFQRFMEKIASDEPAELYPKPRRCTPLMVEAIQGILKNTYSAQGKEFLLQNSVENILLAALEDVDKAETILPELTAPQHEALHRVKELIEENVPVYLGNKILCQKTMLNLFVLSFGFKRLFGVKPYEYYSLLRMQKGKLLLQQGDSINSVAVELEFETPRAFGKAFKDRFGITPKEYQLGFRR